MTEQTTQVGNENVRGSGTNTSELTGNVKLDLRKQIIARATAGQSAEVQIDRETHQSVEDMAASIENGTELPQGDDGVNTVSEDQILRQQGADEQAGTTETTEETTETETVGEDPLIDLKVFGKIMQMPKSKVDEMGGIAVAQMLLGADHRMRQATAIATAARDLHTRADAKLKDVERLEKELRERSSAAGGTPAGQQQGGTTNAPLSDEALRARVKATVGVMFSGDAEGAEKALTEVFEMLKHGQGQMPTADEISNLVLAKVEATLLRKEADDSRKQQERAAADEANDVNALMKTKYKAVNDDPILQAAARKLFDEARTDPRNRGRSLVTIADEVGTRVLERAGGGKPNTTTETQTEIRTRTNMKRRLPAVSSTSERSTSGEEKPAYPTTGKDIVAMYRAARGQPPQ